MLGGAPVTICEVTSVYMGGAYWAPDGFIYFTPSDLMRVSAAGGQPELLAKVDPSKDADYQSPQLLPGGKAVLLTRRPLNVTSYDDAVIFAYRLDTHESVTLIEGGAAGAYLTSRHLLYARGSSFFAVRSGRYTSEPVSETILAEDQVPAPPLKGHASLKHPRGHMYSYLENTHLVHLPSRPGTVKCAAAVAPL
jgi:hypothetical protein